MNYREEAARAKSRWEWLGRIYKKIKYKDDCYGLVVEGKELHRKYLNYTKIADDLDAGRSVLVLKRPYGDNYKVTPATTKIDCNSHGMGYVLADCTDYDCGVADEFNVNSESIQKAFVSVKPPTQCHDSDDKWWGASPVYIVTVKCWKVTK